MKAPSWEEFRAERFRVFFEGRWCSVMERPSITHCSSFISAVILRNGNSDGNSDGNSKNKNTKTIMQPFQGIGTSQPLLRAAVVYQSFSFG